ncbi:MAG: hypothetical protein LBF00_00225 [Mycoplasmataceae bacterium]|nr:hypothetical protein [Mycoplasmataceae bacterium]
MKKIIKQQKRIKSVLSAIGVIGLVGAAIGATTTVISSNRNNEMTQLNSLNRTTNIKDDSLIGDSPSFIMDIQPSSITIGLPQLDYDEQCGEIGCLYTTHHSFSINLNATKLMTSFSVLDDTLLNTFIKIHGITINNNKYVDMNSVLNTGGLVRDFKAAILNGDNQFGDFCIDDHMTWPKHWVPNPYKPDSGSGWWIPAGSDDKHFAASTTTGVELTSIRKYRFSFDWHSTEDLSDPNSMKLAIMDLFGLDKYIYICRDASAHCYNIGLYDVNGNLDHLNSMLAYDFDANYFYNGSPQLHGSYTLDWKTTIIKNYSLSSSDYKAPYAKNFGIVCMNYNQDIYKQRYSQTFYTSIKDLGLMNIDNKNFVDVTQQAQINQVFNGNQLYLVVNAQHDNYDISYNGIERLGDYRKPEVSFSLVKDDDGNITGFDVNIDGWQKTGGGIDPVMGPWTETITEQYVTLGLQDRLTKQNYGNIGTVTFYE